MQACQHGHWEVVLILILFGANIHRSDYLNGGTALHLAALNGHPRCIRILLSEYIPSVPNCWSLLKNKKTSVAGFDSRSKVFFVKN
jgi:E3 ubiquitin-protein ligase XBAT32/33